LLQSKIVVQTDVLKQLKDSKADKTEVQKAAELLLSLKRDLSLAEINELLEYDSTPNGKNSLVIDWKSVPVMQDAKETRLKNEINELKLKLQLEQNKSSRLKKQVRNNKLREQHQKDSKEKISEEKKASDT
jgi:hypothetical protein